ncbi:hypothetical protein PoB_000680700 [Plakobranchus ocellatus]|uniref:Uncharacterized protein n=1 Tax=Plakobranchus ocellatus TaxID=259542 RepID=A0AAV3YDW0_9GAST|nr:hypothetical protein PoB_000680700 [Plakobranchus ocellatus]
MAIALHTSIRLETALPCEIFSVHLERRTRRPAASGSQENEVLASSPIPSLLFTKNQDFMAYIIFYWHGKSDGSRGSSQGPQLQDLPAVGLLQPSGPSFSPKNYLSTALCALFLLELATLTASPPHVLTHTEGETQPAFYRLPY